jgi:phospholipid/cholesterol/gamma-HCH transport system ATP-binding protein
MKQRDVSHTSSLVVTHRIQDAFILAKHRFNRTTNQMEALPAHQTDPNTTFLMLHQGHLVFDGTTKELVHSNDAFIKEYIS